VTVEEVTAPIGSSLFVLRPHEVADRLVFTRLIQLVFYCTSTQDMSICANLPGGLLARAFEDSQRGTYMYLHTGM